MFRRNKKQVEFFLVHPGGPFFAKKDLDVWSIPKGEIDDGEDLFEAAIREFGEEIGYTIDPHQSFIYLGEIKQKSGKIVHAWAFEGDLPAGFKISGGERISMKWPPGSNREATFFEIDRAEFFPLAVAKEKIVAAQAEFLDRLSPHIQ